MNKKVHKFCIFTTVLICFMFSVDVSEALELNRKLQRRISFFEVHLEPVTANNEMFKALEEFVNLANQHKVKLTLLFTPQWAEMLLNDKSKLSLLNQWRQSGHEIGAHHHGPSVCPWDGYTNLAPNSEDFINRQQRVPCPQSVRENEKYSGNMEDYMKLLSRIGSIKTITMSDEDVDFPEGVFYAGGGRHLQQAISKPRIIFLTGHKVYKVTAAVLLPKPTAKGEIITIEDLKREYLSGKDGVFGVVAHIRDYVQNKILYKQWFQFLNEQDPKMTRSRTISQVIEESLGLRIEP